MTTVFNPYTSRGVIKDKENFFGRSDLMRRIKAIIKNKQCCALVGERKMGKSSILYHLWQTLRNDEAFKDLVLIYLDVSDVSIDKPASFFGVVQEEVQRHLKRMNGSEIPIRKTDDCYSDFREFLTDLKYMDLTLYLLLDEFDSFAGKATFNIEFRQFLRAQMRFDFAYITATFRDLDVLFPDDMSAGLTSPWYNAFLVHRVTPFTLDEAKTFICNSSKKAGLPLKAYMDKIIEWAGTHPLLLQIVCGHLFDVIDRNKSQKIISFEAVKNQIAKDGDLRFQLQLIWDCLDKYEKKAAIRLAHQERIKDLRVKEALQNKGYLRESNEDMLFSKLFEDYVLTKGPEIEFPGPKKVSVWNGEKKKLQLSVSCNLDRKLMSVTLSSEGVAIQSDDSPNLLDLDVDRYAAKAEREAETSDWRFGVKDIGLEDIFEDMFSKHPVLLNMYNRGVGRVYTRERDLSLIFKSQRDFLRAPLEFLFDGQDYLVLRHPFWRYISGITTFQNSISSLLAQKQEKIRVLLIASNTEPRIAGADEEIAELKSSFGELFSNEGIDSEIRCIPTEEATHRTVKSVLRNCSYHILHYAGHGRFDPKQPEESAIYFWDKKDRKGQVKAISAGGLATLVRGSQLRFVYLSCCLGHATGEKTQLLHGDFLGMAESLIVAGVPAVLGYRWAVSDEGAITMATTFYESLLENYHLGEALLDARIEVASEGRSDRTWLSPILINQQ